MEENGFARALAAYLNRVECSTVSVKHLQLLIETNHGSKIAEVDPDCSPEAVIDRFFESIPDAEAAIRVVGRKATQEKGFAFALGAHLNANESACYHVKKRTLSEMISAKYVKPVKEVDALVKRRRIS